MRDLRQAVNVLLHRPWYSASIVTVIAVGFALFGSVLAIVDGVLFKPLGYPGESQLVAIHVSSSRSRSQPNKTPADVVAWGRAAPGVAFTGFRVFGTRDNRIGLAVVQPNFFDVIGVRPAIGGFAPEDFAGPAFPLIQRRILTHEIFRTQFGGDAGAIGRTVIENPSTGSGYRVVGVMPREFVFPWDRSRVGYLTPGNNVGNLVVARLPPGVTASDVRGRVLAAAATRTSTDSPAIDQVDVQPLSRTLGAASRPLFTAFLAGAVLLVLIAALNAASLMHTRSFDRRRELAVRRALGATSWALGRLLLVEVALLIGAGITAGLALAAVLLRVIVPLLPDDLGLLRAAAVDWRVVVISACGAVAIVGVSTMALLRRAMATGTRLEPERNVTERTRATSRRMVATLQVALALVLTVAGSLLVGSLLSVYAQNQPISTDGVIHLVADFLDTGPNADRKQRVIRIEALLDRVRAVPGVEAAAVVNADFLNGGFAPTFGFVAPPTTSTARVTVQGHPVTADYYRVVQPQIVAGRFPTDAEWANHDPVIVVGGRVASHFWPNAPALGQSVRYAPRDGEPRIFTVVGVVKDVRWHAWDTAEVATIYSPYALTSRAQPTFLIRTSPGTPRVTVDILRAMAEADPLLQPQTPRMLADLFVDSVRARRLQAWLFGSFAAASLFVVGIGILGQLAMAAARRTREIGIRMTCGATRGRIVTLMLGEQLVPVAAGLIAGGIGAAWAVGFVKSYLYQVTTSDARVWAAAIGLILITAAAGTLVPALRASRVDPTQALRAE